MLAAGLVGVHERPDAELYALADITQQVPGWATVQMHAHREVVVPVVRLEHDRFYRQRALRDAGRRRGVRVLIERLADDGDPDASWKPYRHEARRRPRCTRGCRRPGPTEHR